MTTSPVRTLVAASVVLATTAHAGVTLVWERSLGADKQGTETAKLEGEKVRIDSDAGKANVVWDGATKTLTTLDPRTKSFTRVDEEKMKASAEQVKAMRERSQALMKDKLATMPPEQRARVEAMMGVKPEGAAPEKPEPAKVTATGKKDTVNGFKCEVYTVERKGVVHETCLVPWASSPVKKEDLKPLTSLTEFFRVLMGSMGGAPTELDPTREMGSYPGFPVRTARVGGEGPQLVTTLKSATRGALGEADFAVPGDYVEKAMPAMPAGHGGMPPMGPPPGKPGAR